MKKTFLLLLAGLLIGGASLLAPIAIQAQVGHCATLQCPAGSYRSPLPGGGSGDRLCECLPDTRRTDPLRVTDEVLDSFDPLQIEGSEHAETFSTPGGIITRLLQFAFPLAGMILFVMIVFGGFQILTGAGSQETMKAGRERVTMAIVGFLLLFASYWIAQILEQIFNINIL